MWNSLSSEGSDTVCSKAIDLERFISQLLCASSHNLETFRPTKHSLYLQTILTPSFPPHAFSKRYLSLSLVVVGTSKTCVYFHQIIRSTTHGTRSPLRTGENTVRGINTQRTSSPSTPSHATSIPTPAYYALNASSLVLKRLQIGSWSSSAAIAPHIL